MLWLVCLANLRKSNMWSFYLFRYDRLKVIGCLARCSGASRIPFTKIWYAYIRAFVLRRFEKIRASDFSFSNLFALQQIVCDSIRNSRVALILWVWRHKAPHPLSDGHVNHLRITKLVSISKTQGNPFSYQCSTTTAEPTCRISINPVL